VDSVNNYMMHWNSIYNEKKSQKSHKNINAQLIIICSLSAKSAFRMISEVSCDIEDWGNDAENSVLLE